MNFESSSEKKKGAEVDLAEFYPGKSSEAGFLAPGENLDAVIARDRATCESHDVTPGQIGEAIEEILRGGRKDEFEVSTKSWRGIQTCPFDRSMQPFGGIDFTITNKKTGKSFNGPGLITHLLKEHDFFEGNTPYRVEPEEVIEVLFEKTLAEETKSDGEVSSGD